MPRIATTGITSWQTTLKWTADCQVPCSGCRGQVKPVAIRSEIHTSVCGNPRDGYSILMLRQEGYCYCPNTHYVNFGKTNDFMSQDFLYQYTI
jgi:hypothetical protein